MTAPTVEEGGAATPNEVLRNRIMNPNVPKSEAEHWAARRIEELESRVVSAPLGEPGGEEDQGSSLRDTHRAAEGPVVGWQPIETHDGSCDSVIVYAPPYIGCGESVVGEARFKGPEDGWWWENTDSEYGDQIFPTHWMPLPAAPDTASPAEQVGIGPLADEPKNTPAPTEKGDGVFSPFNACCYRETCRALARAAPTPGEGEAPVAWRFRNVVGEWTYVTAKDWLPRTGPTVETEKQPLFTRPTPATPEGLREKVERLAWLLRHGSQMQAIKQTDAILAALQPQAEGGE